MKHRHGAKDHKLTDREVELVAKANLDPLNKPLGFFRIDEDTFQCDFCDSRLPHNGKVGTEAIKTDMFITMHEGIACRLCAEANPDWFLADDGVTSTEDR